MPPTHAPTPTLANVPGSTTLDPRRWLAFAVVLVAGFVDLVDSTIVNVAIPSLQNDLGANDAEVEWVVAAYVLAFASLLILSGRLGDMYGRKRMFLLGMAGFTLASLCCGVAASPAMLLAARFGQGASAGLMVPQILAILRVSFPIDERRKAVAIFGAVTGSSAVFGLALGGVIVQGDLFGWGWRPIFLINVPIGVGALVAGVAYVRESRSPRAARIDLIGMVLAVGAVVALIYPLTEGRRQGWPAWTFALLIAAALMLAVFIAYEQRRAATTGSALVDFAVFRSRPFAVGMGMWWLFWIAAGGFFLTWTLFLQEGLRWSPLHAGLTAATLALGVGIGAGTAPDKLVPRFGRNVLVAGGLINATGYLAMAWLVSHQGDDLRSWQLIPVHVVFGVGFGMIVAPTLDLLLGQVRSDEAGNASGLLNTVQQIGLALGVALAGVVFFAHIDHGARRDAGASPPASQRTSACVDAGDCSAAFSRVLVLEGVLLLVTAGGFLALPRHARMADPLAVTELEELAA